MNNKKNLLWLAKTSAFLFLFFSSPVAAQVVPDRTLPVNSQIRQQGNVTAIEGGTVSGKNLFHSFKKLSIPSGGTIYFNNPSGIQSIFTRVTGSSISNIDGLIRANGQANLFFINPNGIIFGKNASLDIGGSFFASTASSVKFADGFEYGTVFSHTPLLTIDIPVGLGFMEDKKEIQVRGNSNLQDISVPGFNQVLSSFARGVKLSGLSVKPGKTLGLVGGNLKLNGATLTAENGQIELGSVDRGSFVNLIPIDKGWTLGYKEASLKNIQLSQGTLVDAGGVSGGSIHVQGAHIKLTDGSVFAIENIGTQGNESLRINATDSLELSGSTPEGSVLSGLLTRSVNSKSEILANEEDFATRKVADIVISTKRLSLQGGGSIGSATNNVVGGGNVIVNASESVSVAGFSPLNPTNGQSKIFASNSNTGNSGNLTILTEALTAEEKGFISTSTVGSGAGGNLIINAARSIYLDGPQSFLGTRALNTGDAGTVKIRTTKLTGQDGGRIDTSTLTSASAGSILINADSIELSGIGKTPSRIIPSAINSSANIPSKITQEFLGIPAIPTGKSGNVTINAKKLNIANGAGISVKNDGTGNAGTLRVKTNAIDLDSQGQITAASASGEGGNILLRSEELQLRNSDITATAGGTGNGGNIIINAEKIAALKNSSITANAVEGRGGNIKIKATGLFVSPDSSITATSEQGVDGNVQIDTVESNLSQATIPVRETVSIPKKPTLCAREKDFATIPAAEGEFYIFGSRTFPTNPLDVVDSSLGWYDPIRNLDNENSQKPITIKPVQEYVEAQGWAWNSDGTIRLTIEPTPEVIPYSSQSTPTPAGCLEAAKNTQR